MRCQALQPLIINPAGAIHYHAAYIADVAHDMKRYAALVKTVDIHVYGIARQAESTSSIISHLENTFKKFRDQKGKMPRKRPLPKVDVLYGLIRKCAKILEDINDLIYRQVDAAVIPQAEGEARPEKRELSVDKLKLLKDEIGIAQTDIQLYTANLELQVTIFFGQLSNQ